MSKSTPCSVEGCLVAVKARGWCTSHYNRWYHNGDPLGAVVTKACKTCGAGFTRTGKDTSAVYCSTACRQPDRDRAKARVAARHAEVMAGRPDRECLCGAVIPGSASLRRIHCSRRCSQRASAARVTFICSEDVCDRLVVALGWCRKHYQALHPNRKSWSNGKPETRRANLRRKTQLRRARLRDPDAESIDRDVIGERDGWRCGLCRKPVDNALAWPHPLSPSLDHIEPLSLGGKHAAGNVQISHLTCNVAKGNRATDVQPLLIG